MKVTFIYHSGYLVELEEHVLLFDYYQGELPAIDPTKKLYVFASHRHHDHFDMQIFELFRDFPDVTYVLSKDIWKKPGMHHVTFMKPGQKERVGDCEIHTLKSTDEGVAFLVKCEGKYIYHAGDLNWWHWNEESDNYNRVMKEKYQKEIDTLAELLDGQKADVAFVPLDARLGDAYGLGMQYFLETVAAKYVFPMHFFEDGYSVCRRFQSSGIPGSEGIFLVEQPGVTFTLEEEI
jgi:hypothetical protein